MTRCSRWLAMTVLCVVACAPEAAVRPAPDTLVIGYQSPPDSLDPFRTRTARTASLFAHSLGMALLVLDPEDGTPMPWLAGELPRVEGMTASWTLRGEARWDDGSPVTAADVAWTFAECNRVRGELGRAAVAISGTTGIEAIDERRFLQTFDSRSAVERLGRGLVVVPAGFEAAPRGFDPPPGCGPYTVSERDSARLVLARKPDWWGTGLPRFDRAYAFARVLHRYVADETASLRLFARGEIDLMGLSAEARPPDGASSASYHLPGFSYVGWNNAHPLLADAEVRRALSLTIPRRRINVARFAGDARLIDDPFEVLGEGPSSPLRCDPAAAARALDRLGILDRDGDGLRDHEDAALQLELLAPVGDLPWVEATTAPWQETLDQLGIRLRVTRLAVAGLLKRLREGDFDAFLLIWRVDETAPSFRGMFHSEEIGGRNFQRTDDAALDAAIDAVERREPGARERLAALIRDKRPITTLFQHPSRVCWREAVVTPHIGRAGVFFPYCRPSRSQ